MDKFIEYKSSRHHYIPRFLIDGFTNDQGLLYIYDKQKDKILSKQRPPKSIFFENDRNTININDNIKSSVIEDRYYSKIDDKVSGTIKCYQTRKLSNIDFEYEDTAILLFFLVTLFWRIPKTDYAAKDLIERSIIAVKDNDIDPELIKADSVYTKISRAGLSQHHISEMSKPNINNKKYHNIHQNENPIYVIGDFPFLCRTQSNKFREFDNTDILFAVSSKRIYSSTNECLMNFAEINSYHYNAAIIHQSVMYIACSDLHVLEKSIGVYKELKKNGLLYSNEGVFKTN